MVERPELLLLASGIQLAGPRLSPSTFANGLHITAFPNPGAARAPAYQATVEFRPEQHSMLADYAVVWWSDSAPSYWGTSPGGGFCYAQRGRRWNLVSRLRTLTP